MLRLIACRQRRFESRYISHAGAAANGQALCHLISHLAGVGVGEDMYAGKLLPCAHECLLPGVCMESNEIRASRGRFAGRRQEDRCLSSSLGTSSLFSITHLHKSHAPWKGRGPVVREKLLGKAETRL